ncbi:ABC transporter permease [Nocardiopsis coralliicola]
MTASPTAPPRTGTAPHAHRAPAPDGSTNPVVRAVLDTWTITRRDIQHWGRAPLARLFGWVWPVILMALFLGLMGGALQEAVGGSYLDFVMPGVLAMTVFLGLEQTSTAVCNDAARGVTDRFRSLPMSGIAVVGGRCAADLADSAVSLTLVTGAGLLFGWRPEAGPAGAAIALGLLLLLRAAMLWLGIFVGLKAGGPEALSPVYILVWPVLFFSSVFIDTATMPRWLGTLAEANPVSATATAVRELLGAPVVGGGTWFAENAPALAVAWPAVLVAVFLPLSVRTYRRLRR